MTADERPAIADLVGFAGRDLADEVLVLPARDQLGAGECLVGVHFAGRRDQAALAAGGAQVTGKRARVEAGDRRHARGAQQVDDLARAPEDRGGGVADDQPAQPGPLRLVVVGERPWLPMSG